MPEIGATLREARMHARIDVSEIEAQTKIRAKYLRALENEEWGLLPGPTFVKSFLRTYAQALGLDGKALVEEYRLHHERPSDAVLEPIVSSPRSRRTRGGRPSGGRPGTGRQSADGRPSRAYLIAVGTIGLLIVVLVVLLVSSGGGSGNNAPGTTASHTAGTTTAPGRRSTAAGRHASSSSQILSLSLRPSAAVYVCLIGDDGRRLIPGEDLQPGRSTPVYHARRFLLTLGNSSVTLLLDGIPRTVAPSAEAIGYSITKALGRQPLAPGHLPTCT
jgi:cytoskeleton protein RodZ